VAATQVATAQAVAQTVAAPPPPSRTISYLEAAKLLIAAGKLDEARKVLEVLRQASPKDPEVLFLLANVAEAKGDLDGAIAQYRAILVDNPAAARVRLELARAFFLKHDDANAARQFQLALSAKLPAAVEDNVDRYLAAIRARRSWSFSFSAAIAPDSNINSATGSPQVDIYGLPFTLSPDARSHSGAGLAIDAAGEWAPSIGKAMRLRLGSSVDTVDYSQSAFDDTTLRVYAGPLFLGTNWQFSPLFAETSRWYGNQLYFSGPGPRLEASYIPSARLRLDGSLEGQWLDYRPNPGQSGPVATLTLGASYALDPSSIVQGSVWAARQDARDPGYANTSASFAVGYLRELPKGFSASIQPGYSRAVFDGPLAAFGATRRDSTYSVNLSLLNRTIHFKGFTPRLSFTYTANRSSIPIYSYNRSRVEVRLTRVF
jgi:outer membrane protein